MGLQPYSGKACVVQLPGIIQSKRSQIAPCMAQVIVVEKGRYERAQDLSLLERDAFGGMYEGCGLAATDDAGISILAGATLGGGTRVNWSASFETPAHVRRCDSCIFTSACMLTCIFICMHASTSACLGSQHRCHSRAAAQPFAPYPADRGGQGFGILVSAQLGSALQGVGAGVWPGSLRQPCLHSGAGSRDLPPGRHDRRALSYPPAADVLCHLSQAPGSLFFCLFHGRKHGCDEQAGGLYRGVVILS
jgi:hypothetical protein